MKKIVLAFVVLLVVTPALATVDVNAIDEGGGVCGIYYTVSSEPNRVRAFAFDITLEEIGQGPADITDINDFLVGESASGNKGYGIFMGSIQIVDGIVTSYGNPIAPAQDPNTAGQIPGPAITVEMGSLYKDDSNAPDDTGLLFRITVDNDCNVVLTLEPRRGGIVLEDPNIAPSEVNLYGCRMTLVFYPDCWDSLTQCHGDVDANSIINTSDWPAFRDSFGKTYPDAAYNPCGDYNRDGVVNTSDWPQFRDNFGQTVDANCPPGDPFGIY